MIIGAGPAGLTAGYEFLTRAGISPVILERDDCVGGISRTVNYKGNRIDIGGHRFFSKSERVMKWWLDMLPLEAAADTSDPQAADRVMLQRSRKSRIYYLRRFFDYPVSLSAGTVLNLGLWRTGKIGLSYLKSAMFPCPEEKTLEHFLINRFGRELYLTFFKSYTEKVWGVPCSEIGAAWGAQRIKGLSVWATILHAAMKLAGKKGGDVGQEGTETSLIEQFLYPKFGPGQMWEEAARRIERMGGEIRTGWRVERLLTEGGRVKAVEAVSATGERETIQGDYFFSTAPVKDLMRFFDAPPPAEILEVSDGLVYRDFITVGLLARSLKIREDSPEGRRPVSDNWIYIQEPDVTVGRLQIFNNWSPYMVADSSKVWLGLEYFCNEGDELWNLPDERMAALAAEELARIGIIDAADVLDSTVLHMEKAYPAYFGSYERLGEIRDYLDRYENLFLLGRNGMHRYNNQDHSMLTAMTAVDNIIAGVKDKRALWEVNTESEYHEARKTAKAASAG